MEQTLEQKQLLEAQATEQAQLLTELETARQDLEKANKSLNSRIEAFERDNKLAKTTLPTSSASAGDAAGRAKLEEQLAQANKELEEAKEELARISMAESMQRMSVWATLGAYNAATDILFIDNYSMNSTLCSKRTAHCVTNFAHRRSNLSLFRYLPCHISSISLSFNQLSFRERFVLPSLFFLCGVYSVLSSYSRPT